MSQSAVFLDRDGVLNDMPLNPQTRAYESPHTLEDLKIYPEVFPALKDLQKQFKLFIVSNQPSAAKGKVSLEMLNEISSKFAGMLSGRKISVEEYYYCFHRAEDKCECRKPSPFFLKKASQEHDIDLKSSWMVGDRDTDIQCGQNAGCKTVLIENPISKDHQGKSVPTAKVKNISDAAKYILSKASGATGPHEGENS
jgi:D-glycero-D-manno-heptose 1,7-bisphosphate phosphatase